MFFKNKHVIASMIVAPILALISYFAVDYYVSEVPHKVKQGQIYKMLVKSNCRWESGLCDLTNGDFKVSITTSNQIYGFNQLFVRSQTKLDSVKFALVKTSGAKSNPKSMRLENNNWFSDEVNIRKTDYLQFVISSLGSVFYTEIPAIFVYKEPI